MAELTWRFRASSLDRELLGGEYDFAAMDNVTHVV
jgi:hypothetical protein